MKKFKKLLAAIMTLIMVATALPMTVFAGDASTAEWNGTADTTWYDPKNPMTEYTLTTAEQLAGLAELVSEDVTFKGVTITLANNMDLYCEDTSANADGDPVTFRPIGDKSKNGTFEGTFDGAGHTIKNLYQNGWDLGYEWGVYGSYGLFGNLNDATIKNLTISGAESYIEGGDVGGITGSATGTCVFEDITIEDSVFATYNNGCGGIIAWSGAGSYTFKDIKIAEDVVLAGLWGSFDSSIGGVVGQAEPGATYNFENVDIACRLDAYNDCTASYDYYNYRMCGMIMGRLEATTTIDGRNYPDLSKYNISMDDVTVEFGSWYDYHYCEPTPGLNGGRGMRVEPGYSYNGLPADYDHSQCVDNHMNSIPFEQLFGGDQINVKGMTEAILKIANGNLAAEVTAKYAPTLEVKDSDSIVKVDEASEGLTKTAVEAAINSEETKRDLSIIASGIVDEVINDTVIEEARKKFNETDKITIVMEHYLDVEVKSVTNTDSVFYMTMEITPKYNLVATTDPDNIITEGANPNAVVIKTDNMNVKEGEVVTITVPVPKDFPDDAKLFVNHVKSDVTYVYETTITGTGESRVATFENPNGFSTFILTTTAPAAKIGAVGYETLAAAVAAVADNQTIVLQKDCDETVTVSRSVTFTLDVNSNNFTGSIDAGANTTKTEENGEYTFVYTAPSKNKTKKYDVIVKSADNGKVEVNDDYAPRGQEITITVKPDKGYELDELTVIDDNDKEIDVKETKDGKYTFEMPKADVTVEASFEKASSVVEDEAEEKEEVKEEVKEEAAVEETTLVLTIGQVIYQLDGAYEVNDVAPIIKADRTFLPIRLVAETLGATVTWNEADQSVTIVKGDTTIVIYIGQAFAMVNGNPVQLDAPAFIANDRTYLPVRFVAENLGATVTWNQAAQTVTIVG